MTDAFENTKPVVVVLDYPGRRAAAHLTELRMEHTGFDCRYLLTPPLPREPTTVTYASQLCAPLVASATEVTAVVSYCGSAPLAIACAARLAVPRRTGLPIVFLDPARCHPAHIAFRYAAMVRQIEGTTARRPLLNVHGLLSTPAQLIELFTEDLTWRARCALGAAGFAEAEAAGPLQQVVDVYVQWLAYLVAMYHLDDAPPTGELMVVVSRRHPGDPGWLGLSKERTVHVDCSRTDLARHDRARRLVREFVGRVASAAIAGRA